MGHTFGLFSKSQKGVLFANMRAKIADESYGNPNNPAYLPQSPNAPRSETDRHGEENNPILGDPGYGQIGRWQTVQLDALENSIDQIIEQYLKDKSWYASVRCREALWNMYRRIEWWVEQQQPPDKTQYQRVLQMIKDCIHKILENAQKPGGSHHGVSLPVCPAPYYLHFSGNYFNHFDATVYEIPLFSMKKDVPFSNKFPDFFRYVSSTEDQEWVAVHSVGRNEQSGSEMILKLDLGLLEIGNSSKITFNWRVKRYGQIRFKYLASAKRGNGMLFYINGQQVGGEWSENSGWQEAAFTLQPGQMYKFDWLIRKMRPEVWQNNGIYIKDVEVVEIVDTRKPPAPKDYDLDGEDVYEYGNWVVRSPQSVAQAHFKGQFITDDLRKKTMTMDLDNECDGTVSFAYKMGVDEEPYPDHDYQLFFDDEFVQRSQRGDGDHGSYARSLHGVEWILNGEYSETETNQAKIEYEIVAGPDTTVDLRGALEVTCPPREIDHWEPSHLGQGIGKYQWLMSGNPRWIRKEDILRLDEPTEGKMIAQTEVILDHEGWFVFSYAHSLRPTEAFEVKVNGMLVHYTSMQSARELVRIPLEAGHNIIEFNIQDRLTEEPFKYQKNHLFTYGNNTGNTYRTTSPLGSYVDVTRGWDVTDAGASTQTNGDTITYRAELNPGAKLKIKEHMRIYPAMDSNYDPDKGTSRDKEVFGELFNEKDVYKPSLKFIGDWKWKDIKPPQYNPDNPPDPIPVGDGVMWAQGHNQNFICEFTASMNNSGYICWQYGGDFDTGEKLELQIDGISVWTGSRSNGDKGTDCMYPLPAGNHIFRWIYQDGKAYTPGFGGSGSSGDSGNSSENEPGNDQIGDKVTDPFGQRCFLAGTKTHKIEYGQVPYDGNSAQSSQWGWKNDGLIYSDNGMQGIKVLDEGKTVTRYFKAPPTGSILYSEQITVYPVKNNKVQGLRKIIPTIIPSSGVRPPKFLGTPYYSINVKGTEPGDKDSDFDSKYTKKIEISFHCEGKFRLNYKFISYLVDKNPRAKLRVYFYPEGQSKQKKLIHEENNNRGYNSTTVDYDNFTNEFWERSAASYQSDVINVPRPGRYTVSIGVTDIYPDDDQNKQNVRYHATIGNLQIHTEDPYSKNKNSLIGYPDYDYETKVQAVIWDLTLDMKAGSATYNLLNGEPRKFTDSFKTLTPGHTYRIEYTLHKKKGETTASGLDAGGFTLSGGSFIETWDAFCGDAQGLLYGEGESPHPSEDSWNPPGPVTTAPDGGSHAWLDVIRLYKNTSRACSGTKIVIETLEEGQVIDTRPVTNEDDQIISIEVENTSDQKKNYEIRIRFEQGCPGDGAMIWGGSMQLDDISKLDPSWAEVTHFEVWNNKPIWMGGCDISNMRVKITREDGKVLWDEKYYGDGYRGFELNDLAPKPYSKYKVEITTDQKGQISDWTGKRYLTTFRVYDFKAYERWVWVPEPFDCQLDFFIDNELIKTSTHEGGYYTFSHPVPKGKHEFKWVFTSLQEVGTRSYEYANLDWMELTNWICDDVYVIPYCEGGGGDKCVEALIKCLLEVWKARPKMCVIGKRIWLFT
ncbi:MULTISPECIES: hypothetical protein [unclassified Paenibacillus]|uniref:hypothetical protein n=1 Tax=unclassified Paenibacillus TaxID=185978 RepID=UPI000CFC6922|nr:MULTISPECIES: hypothetical protein [unclassified Paenibacillus]PRA05186.1 hypothetical protein CQ043_14210 [Paenibacillus sp. MYb63]PRA50469.1 hypothetical protein CQ061_08630 [Paenibacillus sp. MYb67]